MINSVYTETHMTLNRSGAMNSQEVVTGNIEFHTLFTSLDITHTGDFTNDTQKDFESVVQVIGLRAMPIIMNRPVALNGVGANVLEGYGAPTITGAGWIFKFAFEREGVHTIDTLKDELNGIVLNDGTIDSEKGTVSITITSNDLDEDGILNDDDKCPNTPAGTIVDVNGCPVFILPVNNNKVEVTSATCIGNTDGSIGLSVEDNSHDYTITVTGKDDVAIAGENKTASVTGLAKGTYTVCFKVDGQANYEQCFEVVIGEPKALSAFIDVDNDKRTTSIDLSGSNLYNIDINGQRHLVKGDNFTTTLPTGLSIIKISTSLDCQGVIEREIFISEDIHYYPNPTDQDVSVHVSGQDTTVQVSVFSEKGDLIYTQRQQIQDFSRKTKIDLSRQITGTYIVVMDGPTVRKTFKIIRK